MTPENRKAAIEAAATWAESHALLYASGADQSLIERDAAALIDRIAPMMAPRVKPLVWFEVELPSRGGGKFTADAYTIRRIEGLWLLDFAGTSKSAWRWVDLDAAKAAAQADYERRILAALEGGE